MRAAVNNDALLFSFPLDGVPSVCKTLASSKKVPVAQWGSACAARGSVAATPGDTAQQ